jgi:hypothetical protein
MAANGTVPSVQLQPEKVIWSFSNGRDRMAALGYLLLALLLLELDVSRYYNGRERTDASGMRTRVSLLLRPER